MPIVRAPRIVVVVALVATLAACGSKSHTAVPATGAPTATAPATATTTPVTLSLPDIRARLHSTSPVCLAVGLRVAEYLNSGKVDAKRVVEAQYGHIRQLLETESASLRNATVISDAIAAIAYCERNPPH